MTQLQTAKFIPGSVDRRPWNSERSKPAIAGTTAGSSPPLLKALAGLELTDQKLADEIAQFVGGVYKIDGRQRFPPKLLATNVHVITEGWAIRSQMLQNGARQITDVLVPGDFCSTSLCDEEPFYAIEARGPTRIAVLNVGLLPERVRTLVEQRQREQQSDVVRRLRNRLVNLGRRDARERLVHFVVETQSRLAKVQLIEGEAFAWPFTQEDLADILGLTPVHVNRVLGQLRRENLLVVRNRSVAILDLLSLRRISGSDHNNGNGVGWSN